MEYIEHNLRERILNKIQACFDSTEYWLHRDYPRSIKQRTYRFDGYLTTRRDLSIAIVEIKSNLQNKSYFESAKNQCIDYILTFHIPFVILADENTFYLFDEENFTPHEHNLKDIKKIFDVYISPSNTQIRVVLNYLKETFPQENLADESINEDGRSISLPEHLESNIKNLILSDEPLPTNICRYVSLETVFNIISNKTIRMNCIVGMNDSSEINFVGKTFYGPEYLNRIPDEKERINDIYILSCSSIEMKDDLTQWRLYADDAKGVCLVFEVNKPQYRYDVRKITYIDPEQENDSFFGKIKELVSKNNIVFKNFHTWCHFLKPKDYKIEAEVRVLYENKKIKKPHWFLAKPINVLSSYIDVELNDDFPLKLKEIILGPKCPEKETNRDQLNVLLKRMGFDNVKVDFSRIDNYR